MAERRIKDIEELKTLIGQEVAVSDWLTITQDRIDAFAEVTMDPQWIHSDVERCKKESPFGKPIAHGYLTMSLVTHFYDHTVFIDQPFKMGINYGINKMRFPAPVPVDSRIRSHMELQEVTEISGGWQIVWKMTVEVEDSEKPACVAEVIFRLYE
jgi:acyl dehydratase